MPQMMPLMWLKLFILFNFFAMIILPMIYFNPNKMPLYFKKCYLIKKWKWSW